MRVVIGIIVSNIVGMVFGFFLAAILTVGSEEDDWMFDDEDIRDGKK